MASKDVRNRALELQSSSEDDSGSEEREESKMSWKQFLRKKLLNGDAKALEENPWLKELGYDIRDDAVKHVLTAWKINMAKKSKGSIDRFQLGVQSRKRNKSESIYFRTRWFEQGENTMVLKWPGREKRI